MSFTDCKDTWIYQQRRNLLIYQGSLTLLALLVLLVLIFLAADQPPKPPTKAQALLRRENETVKQFTVTQHAKLYVKEMKLLFSDLTFVNIVFSFAILFATVADLGGGDGGMHPPHQPKQNVHMHNIKHLKKSNQ